MRGGAGFSESIIIEAEPAAAFAFLGDPATATVIDPAVVSYVPDRIPMDVGTTNTIRIRMMGVKMPITLVTRVRKWEPPARMVIESLQPAKPVRATAIHRFEAVPEGTRYTWSMEFAPCGFGGRLAARIMCRFMHNNARAQQRRFKQAMEQPFR